MTALSRDDFARAAQEIQSAWQKAQTRDAGLEIITQFGQKYGYKNVIAAIQGRTPKRFVEGQPLSDWIDERREEEASE